MKTFISGKAQNAQVLRRKLIKRFGEYWIEMVRKEKIKEMGLVKTIDNFTNNDILNYMADQQVTPIDFEELLIQFTVVESVEGGKSCVIFKAHHCFGDILATLANLQWVSDKTN